MTNGDPRCPNCGGYLANLGPEHMMFCCLQPKRSESVFSAPATTIPTDAGKRLSDADKAAELVILLRAVAKGTNHIKSRQSIIFEAAADALERLTANRGSVSEERAREILAENCEHPVDAKILRDGEPLCGLYANSVAAIQQAMSECSGGGAEGFHPGEAWRDLVEKDDRKSPEEYPDMCLITRAELFDYMKRALPLPPSPVAEEVATAFYEHIKHGDEKHRAWLKEECDGKLVELIRALPLPPSPVKESRDAQKPVCGTYHSRAIGVACSNCGHLKEEHQGGEGK